MTITVKDLPQKAKDQLEEAEALVQRQQDAIDSVRPALEALAAGVATKGDRARVIEVMRWDDDRFAHFAGLDADEQDALIEQICAPPYAFFYVKNPACQVYVKSGQSVEIREPDHSEY